MSEMKMKTASYFKYWGKAKKKPEQDGANYHLLPYHSLDVGAVGWHLLDPIKPLCKRLAKQVGVEPQWLQTWFSFCLVLHDLGKLSRAFQNLAPNLSAFLVKPQTNMAYNQRHDSLGFLVWQDLLADPWLDNLNLDIKKRYLQPWFEVVTGHHGSPPLNNLPLDEYFNNEDKVAASEFLNDVSKVFLSTTDLSVLSNKAVYQNIKQHSWQFAGIAVLADWLGSNQSYFKYQAEPIPLEKNIGNNKR